MHAAIAAHQHALQALCRHYGVTRLDVFGSAARAADFAPDRSDADFLVTFADARRNDLTNFLDFKDALESLLARPVDLIEHAAVQASRNTIRRRSILAGSQSVYG
jgi:predicted nucleotidyltransferase